MRLIIAGIVLDVIAVVAIAVLIFVPMLVTDNAALNNLLDSLLCETGETYELRPIITEDSEGTGYSLYAVCMGERGDRDVTPAQTIYGFIAFAVPFLPGIGLTLLGVARLKEKLNRPREVTHLLTQNPVQSPIGWPQQSAPTGVSQARTLSEKLAEVDEAYESRRITREEYEAMRKKVIDDVGA